MSVVRIMYEDLCLRPIETLSYIRESCQLGQSEIFGQLSETHGHIGLGNPMRFSSARSQKLRYDYRWFCHTRSQIAWLLSGSARRYNMNLYG